MIGATYWTVGITVAYQPGSEGLRGDQWTTFLKFFDDGFAENGSTEGTLYNRYHEDNLAKALDTLIADASRLGIQFGDKETPPYLYAVGDGNDPNHPYPANWKTIFKAQADRLGWAMRYKMETLTAADEPVSHEH